MRRSWFADTVSRRRKPSARPGLPIEGQQDSTHLSALVDDELRRGRASEGAQGEARPRSRSSTTHPEGMGMGVNVPYGTLSGAVASAVSLASREREERMAENQAQRPHHHHHHSHREEGEDIDSSDYTTDGSEADDEEHHLDDVVEVRALHHNCLTPHLD